MIFFLLMHYIATFNGGCLQNDMLILIQIGPLVPPELILEVGVKFWPACLLFHFGKKIPIKLRMN